jgi:hypothetical protein
MHMLLASTKLGSSMELTLPKPAATSPHLQRALCKSFLLSWHPQQLGLGMSSFMDWGGGYEGILID